jgi:hypothetical protein
MLCGRERTDLGRSDVVARALRAVDGDAVWDEAGVINPDDEAALRLMVFKDALLAITMREKRDGWDDSPVTPVGYIAEARAVADTVVLEAQRLRAERKP